MFIDTALGFTCGYETWHMHKAPNFSGWGPTLKQGLEYASLSPSARQHTAGGWLLLALPAGIYGKRQAMRLVTRWASTTTVTATRIPWARAIGEDHASMAGLLTAANADNTVDNS